MAARLSRILKAPVALLVKRGEDDILVVRSRRPPAKAVGELLLKAGVASDLGGHETIAVMKLAKGYSSSKLKEVLLAACRGAR